MVIDDYCGEQVDLDVYADPANPEEVRQGLLDVDSIAEHWGFEAMNLPSFRESVVAEEDPEFERWRFGVLDGRRVGICQASGRFALEGGGWIRYLGVLPAARGRGSAGMRPWTQVDAFRRRVHAE